MSFLKCFKLLRGVRCMSMVVPRRAMMYVPGDSEKKLTKAFQLDIDSIAMDCEDGVAMNQKTAARDQIKAILNAEKPVKYDLGVRVNSIDSPYFVDDMETIFTTKFRPDSILLPKAHDADQIKFFADTVKKYDSKTPVKLVMIIETASGVVNLTEIAKASVKYDKLFTASALALGGDDLFASIGAKKSEDLYELSYARQKLVVTAKAFQLQALDVVYIKYKDMEGLKKQCIDAFKLGYTGKQLIHPNQIQVVQNSFMPTKEQVEWATEMMQAFEEHQKTGEGAFGFKGSMIDMPTMKQAQYIFDLHKAKGK